MNEFRNLIDHHHWPDTAQVFAKGLGQDDQVISTNRGQLHIEGVLVVVSRVLLLMRDELLRVHMSANNVVVDKVDHSDSVRPILELEV